MLRLHERTDAGFALLVSVLVVLAVGAVALAGSVIGSNAAIVTRYDDRQGWLEAAALAGIEEIRSRLNGEGGDELYPDSGYTTLENRVPVIDASGSPLPGLTRTSYVGPTGVVSGQYGVSGSVVAVVEDVEGNRVIRRGEIYQESFAKYAYFSNIEGNIYFAGGEQIFGPVHSNDRILIHSTGVTFRGPVVTAQTIEGKEFATFRQGYTERGPRIELPEIAELAKLRLQAEAGGMAFQGSAAGEPDQATLRIEFVAIDLNGDGATSGDDEGFIRVYESSDPAWVAADVPPDYASNGLRASRNCGHYHDDGTFVAAADHPAAEPDGWMGALNSEQRRCFLGGSDSLFNGFQATDPFGRWLVWPGPVDPRLVGRPDAAHLFPIHRALNPSFKGVIFVDGKVVVSGLLRGRVTLAATGNIIIGDDVRYVTDPGSGTCVDILGVLSGADIVVADNTLNAPQRTLPQSGQPYWTFDDTKDEFIQGFMLALNQFRAHNYADPPTNAEACEARPWGRGCLYLTGGVIQHQRGAVGLSNGAGYLKRYSYDACGFTAPPPYFPTTGHFVRARTYEVDPIEFNPDVYFDRLTNGS